MKTTRRTWFARLAALFGAGLVAPRLAEAGTWRFEYYGVNWTCTNHIPSNTVLLLDEEFREEYDAYARGDHLKQ